MSFFSAYSGQRRIIAFTAFLSSLLLFSVQPLLIRYLLPWFGGSAAVWTAAFFFFMCMLSIGYACIFFFQKIVSPLRLRTAYTIFIVCVIGYFVYTLLQWSGTFFPPEVYRPDTSYRLIWQIILMLLVSIGAPYVLLATTTPMLHHGVEQLGRDTDTFHIYRWSNIGSLVGLALYALVIQPFVPLSLQAAVWVGLFGLYVILLFFSLRFAHHGVSEGGCDTVSTVSWRLNSASMLKWFSFPFLSSAILMSVINQLGQSTGSFSLLLLLPLIVYLLTYILAFREKKRMRYRMIFGMIGLVLLTLWQIPLLHLKSIPLQVVWAIVFMYVTGFVLHRSLFAVRPQVRGLLPLYYLVSSVGGALGASLITVISPLIFSDYYELYILLFVLLLIGFRSVQGVLMQFKIFSIREYRWLSQTAAVSLVVLAVFNSVQPWVAQKRNFYGVLSVGVTNSEGESGVQMVSGKTIHGFQYRRSELTQIPTTYFSKQSGIGLLLDQEYVQQPRVFVAGLGTGTLATYCPFVSQMEFAELNPAVISLAEQYFSFLSFCPGKINITEGDARLILERSTTQYDIIIVDAFTDDVIPEHLLTKEAVDVYLQHLTEKGVLAIHISNRFIMLDPLMKGIQDVFGLPGVLVQTEGTNDHEFISRWAFFSYDPAIFTRTFVEVPYISLDTVNTSVLWSDDKSSIIQLLTL